MDDERFMSVSASHEIPRSLGFAQDRLGRPQPNLSPRATPTILERFRAMLRSREDELRDDGDYDTPPPPDGDEIVGMFSELLTDLTFNSKPIITELTIIAGDQREHARGIVEAVCDRIDEVPQDQKLPALYLLDSIVKNIGDEYVRYFAARLPKMFCQAYNDVHSSLHAAMHRLFRTWSQVFPHSVLNKIKDELKFPSPENQRPSDLLGIQTSDSPHPSHGIHVNPKYLEARHHIEDPADILHSGEVPSGIQAPDHKSFTKYGDHNLDHLGFQSSNLKMVKEGSPQTLHGSSMAGQEGTFFSSQRKVATRLSPTRFEFRRSASPQVQRFKRSSPGQMVEAPSRCYSELEFQSDRSSENNGWFGRSMSIDDGGQQPVALTAYSMHGRQRQRDLIDAYGNYRGKSSIYESYHKIPRVNINGLKGESRKMDWQNSEEEEYVWEDMSPTLGDLGKRNSIQSEPSSGKLELINSNRPGIIAQKSDFRRRSWPAPPIKDTTTTTDDRIEIQDYNHGPMNRIHADDSGSTNEPFRHYAKSHVSEELAPIPWDKHGSLPHTFHHPMRDNLSPKSQGRPFQLPYFVNGATPSVTHKWHSSYDNTHPTEVPFLKFSASPDPLNLEMQTIASQKGHQPPFAPTWAPQPHKSQPLQLLPTPNLQVNNNKPLGNQQLNFSLPLSLQQGDANGKKILRHPLLETRGGFIQPTPAQTAANFTQPLINLQPLGQNGILDLPNHISGTTISAVQNIPMPPLPPGPPPLLSQPLTTSQNNSSATSNSSVSGFSGLISSLMAQGLISLIPPAQSQATVGLEFNADLLKIRHESAINAMYSELPRQCTTCGLRFTCQEDHSSHMDWHVTKNRISKNRKQNSSRKWFVSAKEWLCGAETLGADVVPGFLPTETVPDRKKEREIAVPADENQTACALCGEPFEDFYSDETEEWMYRGAVYLNSPNWDIEGLDRSQMGPIVHVKCRSESSEGSGQA